MPKIIFDTLKSWLGIAQTLTASCIIAAGWGWYHFKHRPHSKFILLVLGTFLAVFIGYRIGKWLYHFFTARFNRHVFWQREFGLFLDSLFFYFSLLFLVFFSRNQLLSLALFLLSMGLFFLKTQRYLSLHPHAHQWKLVNRQIFVLIFFLFGFFAAVQYLAFRLANFDTYLKFHNIVLFRAWAMVMFFVLGFSVATLIYWKLKSWPRYFLLGVWSLIFILILIGWVVNINILYFTGLYFSPLMLAVAKGSGDLATNLLFLTSLVLAIAFLITFIWVMRRIVQSYRQTSFRQWGYYSLALIAVALGSLMGLSSFQNTPEYTIAKNFYHYFRGNTAEITLDPALQNKLEKFGLFYDLNRFDLAHKDKIYLSDKKTFIPRDEKPNVIIIFFESFSSRLTSVYNKNFPGLTPNLEQMAADPKTTVFKNFYNAATPTINGIIAQLCSFLPPTGYSEIENNRGLQNLKLLCLPNILKKQGYYNTYITAVPKEFENKASIFASMDTEHIYGQDELGKMIAGEPLSWGYSDHQLFDFMWKDLKFKLTSKKQAEPFLMMLSTVNTHAPFDLAKDMVPYGDGKNNVLNSFYTADNAFGRFWEQFKQSRYADNTIVVAVADHAAFPGADIKKLAGADGEKLSFYDENMLMMYVPQANLPKEVRTYSSSIDLAPTLLNILGVNVGTNFEGHSIFDDRQSYQNILGMHEYGLYINQEQNGQRKIDYQIPSQLECDAKNAIISSSTPLTLCEYLQFYKWKRQMFEQGRFWNK